MLTVITGPMFSGKSSTLISKAISHVIAGDIVVAFKPNTDNRYTENNIATHYGDKFPAFAVGTNKIIEECYGNLKGKPTPNVILIDEAQFFEKEGLIALVHDFVCWSHVIIAGLAQDSYGKPFGAMPELLSFADNIVCLKAVCSKCKKVNSATRTYRKTKDKTQVVVGGIDSFEPRCFECWDE